MKRNLVLFAILWISCSLFAQAQEASPVFRLGIIGTDTSHVPAFVGCFNDPNAEGLYKKYEITGAYKGGMPDNPSSWDRVEKYATEISTKGVKIYSQLPELLANVDGILLEDVDGRPHWEFARQVIDAGKPLFIDKPMAGNLIDALDIFRRAEEKNVPIFSASSLRYSEGMQTIRNQSPLGETFGVDAWSPCSLNPQHPDFYWYGIHGVETLFTMMGAGCVSVSRTSAPDCDVAVGLWDNGRIGSFRGIRKGNGGYGAFVFGAKGKAEAGKYDGYKPLCDQICAFFEKGKPEFDRQETIEILAFMTAADVSKKLDGKHVKLADVIDWAKNAAVKTFVLKIQPDGSCLIDDQPIERDQIQNKVALPADNSDPLTGYKTLNRVIIHKDPAAPQSVADEIIAQLGSATFSGYYYE